jgi:hypothetical protein
VCRVTINATKLRASNRSLRAPAYLNRPFAAWLVKHRPDDSFIEGILAPRMTGFGRTEPDCPLRTGHSSGFNIADLAVGRQRVITTLSGLSPASALGY